MSILVLKKPLASPETVIVSLTPSMALIVYPAKHLFKELSHFTEYLSILFPLSKYNCVALMFTMFAHITER